MNSSASPPDDRSHHGAIPFWRSSRAVNEGLAGITSGLVSTLVLHPLDFLKIRLQVDPTGRYQGGRHALRSVISSAGVRTLWSGLTLNLAGNACAWGLWFGIYGAAKRHLSAPDEFGQPPRKLTAADHMLAAGITGCGVTIATNPIWVMKTRVVLHPEEYARRSLSASFRHLVATEGTRALFRGVGPGLLNISHGMVQFAAYEHLRALAPRVRRRLLDGPGAPFGRVRAQWLREQERLEQEQAEEEAMRRDAGLATKTDKATAATDDDTSLRAWETVLVGGVSKVTATLACYPLQLIRSRMQAKPVPGQPRWDSVRSCVGSLLRNEGPMALWKGAGVATLRVLPHGIIIFLVYEEMRAWLNRGLPPPAGTQQDSAKNGDDHFNSEHDNGNADLRGDHLNGETASNRRNWANRRRRSSGSPDCNLTGSNNSNSSSKADEKW